MSPRRYFRRRRRRRDSSPLIPPLAPHLFSPNPSTAAERSILDQETPAVYLPEDIILNGILPCVPFKPLCRFKLVCRPWAHFISRHPAFASLHSRRCRNPGSGLIFAARRRLHLLPTLAGDPDDVGLPDPLLSFKGEDRLSLSKIVASTNGLLCLLFRRDYERLLYVCNPITREGHFIPDIKYKDNEMGLAFDIPSAASPTTSLHMYQLVHADRRNAGPDSVEYRFEVFSSNTNKWVESGRKVTVQGFLWTNSKSVFVDGVLYWDCVEYLLWFDCRSLGGLGAGWLPMPHRRSDFVEADIGVWQRRLTWTWVSGECMEVWVLSGRGGGGQWERVHCVSLEAMVADNQEFFASFWHTMSLRNRTVWEGLFRRFWVRPLPFEGGDRLLLRLRKRAERRLTREKVLCYDMKSRQVVELFMGEMGTVFGYQNTLICLPK